MAEIPQAAVAENPKTPAPTGTAQESAKKPQSPPKPAATFKRNIFIKKEETGRGVSRYDRRQERMTPENVEFSEELKTQYRRFLDDYVTNLAELGNEPDPANPQRTLLNAILDNPNHIYDKELLSILMDNVPDKDGRIIERKVNENKIELFLKDQRGWMITTQLLEYRTTLQLFALGLHAAMRPPGERQAMANTRIVRLYDQGWLNQPIMNRLWPWLSEAPGIGGRRAIDLPRFLHTLPRFVRGAIAAPILGAVSGYGVLQGAWNGLIVGGLGFGEPILGALTGAITGAVAAPAAAAALWRGIRGGVQLDIRQCAAAFQTIRGSAIERAYMKATTGIDVNDYRVVPGAANQIEVVPGRRPETMRNVEDDLKKEVLGKLYTRMEFYTALNVPPESIDALPSQAQYWFTGGQPEQTGARWGMRVADRFRRLGGPTPTNLRLSIQRFTRAQREIMLEDIKDYMRVTQTLRPNKELSADAKQIKQEQISNLEAKRKARTEGGAVRAERTRQFTEDKSVNEGVKNTAQEERNTVNQYHDTVIALRNARGELQTMLTTITINGAPVTTFEDALLQLNRVINQPGFNANINGRDIPSVFNRIQAARTTRNNNLNNIPTTLTRGADESEEDWRARERAERESIEEDFKGELAGFKEDIDFINRAGGEGIEPGIIKQLQNLNARIEENQNKLLESDTNAVQTRDIFNTLTPDFDAITGIDAALTGAVPPLAAVGLTENDLATLSIDELMRRVNNANVTGVSHTPPLMIGWLETQNGNPELRTRLIHAVMEARARQTDPAIANPNMDFIVITNGPWNISQNQLLSLTADQINQLITNRLAANPAVAAAFGVNRPTIAEIGNSQREAQNRLTVRFNTYEQLLNVVNRRIEQLDAQISGVNFDRETGTIDMTLDLMNRQGEIFSNAWSFAYDSARLVNISVPAAGDPDFNLYSPAEQAAATAPAPAIQPPRGYYEIMDLLFDYRNKDNRSEAFRRAMELLPPQRLAELLNASLDLGVAVPVPVGPVAPITIGTVLGGINNGLNTTRRLASFNMQGAFRDIINRLYQEANAL